MSINTNELITKEKPHLIKYRKYILENTWEHLVWKGVGKPKTNTEVRKGEFDLHNNIVLTVIARLKQVIKKSDGDHHLKVFKDYVKQINHFIVVQINPNYIYL